MTAPMATERPCPECDEPMPVLTGYPDWCDRCGWNLKPPPTPEPPVGRFGQMARTLGRRGGERMARQLLSARELKPRLTPAKAAAYAVAVAVHLLTLALIAGGIAAIVAEYTNPISILIGLAMIGVGYVIRPRVPALAPDTGYHADPAATPVLHELAGEIARALDRPPPDEIIVSPEFTAAWTVVGLRRRRVLIVGLPLLAILEPRERVAVIAHEIGHDRNGDLTRGLIVGSAVHGLDWLAELLDPFDGHDLDGLVWLTNALVWLVSRPVEAVLWIEARLMLRDFQRAEYLADALAARVAGSGALIALHERLLLASTFALTVQHAAHEDAADVLDRLQIAVQLVPERERERRRRVTRLESTRLESTHPPTGMRIALIEGRQATEPEVALDDARSRMIDAELAPFAERVNRELLDAYRSRLYYG
jgi:Zn-dependent protease with chaperone function